MMKAKRRSLPLRMTLIGLCTVAMVIGLTTGPIMAQDTKPQAKAAEPNPDNHGHGSLSEVGKKLSNPVGAVWALSMNFETPKFFDGDINTGNPRVGADMIFQPILPFPLYGTGDEQWRLISRPVIPFIFSNPVPKGFNDFNNLGGIGDIELPLLINLPKSIAGNWIFGAGPVFQFPSATNDPLGSNQWGLGPAVVFGYANKYFTAVLFPNYFWKIGSCNQDANTPDLSKGSLLYALTFNLPDAWQVGMNPTIAYNDKASSGNKWNVPVGLFVGKTIKIGKMPINIKVGLEYSVVSQNDFGKRTAFRFLITPVIPGLVKNPIFGK